MFRVIFVCLGNICRSPMAHGVFLRLLKERGLTSSFDVDSFATSDWEEGNPIYPPAKEQLKFHDIEFSHRSQLLTLAEVQNADFVLVMDQMNLMSVIKLTAGRYGEKIFKLGSFAKPPFDIDDPYYTRDFARAFNEIYTACNAFLDFMQREHGSALEYDKYI